MFSKDSFFNRIVAAYAKGMTTRMKKVNFMAATKLENSNEKKSEKKIKETSPKRNG